MSQFRRAGVLDYAQIGILRIPVRGLFSRPKKSARPQQTMPKKQQTYRIPLHEAWHRFASRPLKERLRSAQTLPNPKAPDIRTMDQDDQMRVALEHIAKMAKHYSNKTDPVFEMQRELCHKLIIGKLEAWGYRTQPDIRNEIEQISRYMFRGKIDWHKCTVTNGAQKYEGIEVARAHISGATHKSSRDTALLIAQERRPCIGLPERPTENRQR